jgi:hypothetical protein
MAKIILDLCGGSGSWSRPYLDAGYDVRLVTLPESDVLTYTPPKNVYGVLAAPPCTDFALSGARWWARKGPGALAAALVVVDACFRIVRNSCPSFWALENPVGRLSAYLGPANYIFDPYFFGDAYTKKTCLWGDFNIPRGRPIRPVFIRMSNGDRYSPMHAKTGGGSERIRALRSITPSGFARAFFEANP